MPQRTRAHRRRLRQHADAPERLRDRNQLGRVLGDHLAREAVQPRDATLAVVTRQARVGRGLCACDAVPARPAHRRRDEVAAREAVAVLGDDRQHLVPEHERPVVRRDAEEAVRDLAVGAADADLERPQDDRPRRPVVGHLADARRARAAGLRHERERHARSTAPSDADVTCARYRANTPLA
jgi:hypothetical protein